MKLGNAAEFPPSDIVSANQLQGGGALDSLSPGSFEKTIGEISIDKTD